MNPITREESLLDGQDLTPITRKEQFIKRIYDKTQEVPTPVTREEYFLKKAGEGTSPVAIEQLNVTENGTYSETGKAYSPVIVEVPEPTLITKTITENGTYNASEDNADGYSQVTVNVPYMEKKSASGDIASFSDGAGYPFLKVKANINPVQDLHGYDYPWVGGGGKNKVDETAIRSRFLLDAPLIANTEITVSVKATSGTTNIIIRAYGANESQIDYWSLYQKTGERYYRTLTLPFDTYKVFFNANGTISECQLELGNQLTSYSPYSNICPISGHTEADVTVTDDLTTPTETHTLSIPFHDNSDNPITVYGGRLNVTSGELTATHANIASYNGETINEPWISSMDVYSAGATPTTGAQVVYPLATPQTYQLTPQQINTLIGQNNVWNNTNGQTEVEYFIPIE